MRNNKILKSVENKRLECDAVCHIEECTSIKEQLIEDKNSLILVKVNNTEIGLCDSDKFLDLLNNEIKQAKFCLDRKPNKFAEFLFCT
jgi:hypothetical protein